MEERTPLPLNTPMMRFQIWPELGLVFIGLLFFFFRLLTS